MTKAEAMFIDDVMMELEMKEQRTSVLLLI